MPKFYFQLTAGLTRVPDTGGKVFADAAAARQHATACTEAFSRRIEQFNGSAGLYWSVQVVDEQGAQVFTLQLAQPPSSKSSSKA